MTERAIGAVFDIDAKSLGESGVLTGYASMFGEVDLGRDVVQPGAFTKSLMARPATKVKMLRDHNPADPVGVFSEIVQDAKGLHVTGQLVLETQLGRETYSLLKAGALNGLSIGYRTKASRLDKSKGVRLLDEIDLYEISIVTFPMLPSATVNAVKHHPNSFTALVEAINSARANLH